MTEATTPHPGYSAKAAFIKYTNLQKRIEKFSSYSEKFKVLLDPVKELLQWYIIEESEDDITSALIYDRADVCSFISDHMATPDDWFATDIIGRITLCIRIMHDVADLYDIKVIDNEFKSQIMLSHIEKKRTIVHSIILLCYLMDISPLDTRTVINRYSKVKSSISNESERTTYNAPSTQKQKNIGNPQETSRTFTPPAFAASAEKNRDSNSNTSFDGALLADENYDFKFLVVKKVTLKVCRSRNRQLSLHTSVIDASRVLSESIEITLRDFDQCSVQYRLTPQQRAEFFVNILAGEARTFFLTNVR